LNQAPQLVAQPSFKPTSMHGDPSSVFSHPKPKNRAKQGSGKNEDSTKHIQMAFSYKFHCTIPKPKPNNINRKQNIEEDSAEHSKTIKVNPNLQISKPKI